MFGYPLNANPYVFPCYSSYHKFSKKTYAVNQQKNTPIVEWVFSLEYISPWESVEYFTKKPTNEKFLTKSASPLDKFQEPMHLERLTTAAPRYALLFLDNIIPINNQ